jgi:hypothetical protein
MENRNPPVTKLFRTITVIEIGVLLVSGVGLFFLPDLLSPIWPWELTPFNTRFLGAIYLGAIVAVIAVVWWGRWSPAREVIPAVSLFSMVALIISVIYWQRFLPTPSTWLWFAFYIMIFANALYHLWLYRKLPPAEPMPPASPLNSYLLVQGILLGLYGLGLLVAPITFSGFWPWALDEFHARMYSVEFFAPALASFLLVRAAAREELLVLGWTQIIGGFFAIAGLVVVDAAVHRVDWSQLGTWAWLGMFGVLFLTGIWMIWQARGMQEVSAKGSRSQIGSSRSSMAKHP